METIVKEFKRRSSATDVLRQLGIKPRDYNLFIEPVEGGAVKCQISLAQEHAKKIEGQLSEAGGKGSAMGALSQMAATLTTEKPAKPAKSEKRERSSSPAATAWPYPTSTGALVRATKGVVQASTGNRSPVLVPKDVAERTKELKVVKDRKTPKKGSATPAKKAKTPAEPKAPKEAKRTVSSVARELIVAGKTNDEVWEALVKEFKLGDEKKSYPAWYRRDCIKKGLIKAAK